MGPPRERMDAPESPVEVTPEEYERQVYDWLQQCVPQDVNAAFDHQGIVKGAGGEYAIDVLVSLEVFGGAVLRILVECKHQKRRVERDEVLVLEGKLRDVGAHKGMLFSTSGFQDGAIKYAAAHGIATLSFIEGKKLYVTKAVGPTPEPPPWVNLPHYAGVCVSPVKCGIRCATFYGTRLDPLAEWLADQLAGISGDSGASTS
ncbi:MAG: restriction endonuclease [Phycisphaerae bacterium]